MSGKIKLMMVAPYFLTGIGGLENYVKNISLGLSKNYPVKVFVVTTSGPGKRYAEEIVSGIKIYRLPILFKISNSPFNPFWLKYLKEIITQENPDIINAHTPTPFLADFAALAAKKVPFVLTYHAGYTPLGRGLLIDIFTKIYESLCAPFLFKKATKIISSSEFVKATVLKKFAKKTVTITPGVDVALFKPKKSPEANRILFVGSLKKAEKYKGLDILIKAMAEIVREVKEVRLVVVGDGDCFKYYKNLAKEAGISPNVIFKGRLAGKKLACEYQQATLLVHPSLFDSCPLVVLEAMASAKTIIGFNTSGIPDLVINKKNGLLVRPGDAHLLARAIIKVLANPALAEKMGKESLRRIKKDFTWEGQLAKTNALINQIAKV